MKTINKSIQLLLLCVFPFASFAQKKDSLAPLREFLNVSNSYKQMPLYLEVELKNSTNFITSERDTMAAIGKFYLQQNISYMQFGEMEQLVTDSIAILVSDEMQRIIVNNNPKPVLEGMKHLSGLLNKDSSVLTLGKKYKAEAYTSPEGAMITLNSRDVLYGTVLPKETIEMSYDSKTKQPININSTKRALIPLSEEDYNKLRSEKGIEKAFLKIEEKGYFLMKEQTTVLVYKKIEHNAGLKIPVAVYDRIIKNKDGEYEPVKAYEDYAITIN